MDYKPLDDIYQESIAKLEEYWTMASEEGDETIVVDAILASYEEQLKQIGVSYDEIVDWLTEMAFNGIT